MKAIIVTCEAKERIPLDSIIEVQGNLAELSKENFEKLKASLLKYGISFAFSVWRNGKKNLLLDGHARVRTLKLLRSEGWDIPDVPVVMVKARSEKEAREKLLLARSEYHKTTMDGLYEYLEKSSIRLDEMKAVLDLPGIRFEDFEKGYGPEPEAEQGQEPEKTKCPECGFEF